MKFLFILALFCGAALAAEPLTMTREDYEDRVNAIWHGQIIAVLLTLPFEHRTAAVEPVRAFPKAYHEAFVDDDWYYEMCAVRAFEKHGIGLTVRQLGEQWLENSCGSYGSSKITLANLKRGIPAPDCGHPRHNRLWWTIGPVFTADLFGAIAPAMPNEAGRLAREYCRINGFGEAVDGAVTFAGAISLGFVEKDVRTLLKRAVTLVDAGSPYRQCLDSVIQMAEAGRAFEDIAQQVEDRWRIEYPASNNAVPNGGLCALCLWFGEGDFWKTIDLASRAADFSDTDNSAASAVAVIAAMKGMKALPPDLVAQLGDRIAGAEMGGVPLTPAVDERISSLAQRTAAIGEKIILSQQGGSSQGTLTIHPQTPATQPAAGFTLARLMDFWNPAWQLERAGFGGDGVGAMPGIRGLTALDRDALLTYPRDEARGLVLRHTSRLGANPSLQFQVAAGAGKAWELNVYAGNRQVLSKIVSGETKDPAWETVTIDLKELAGQETTLRLYQRVLLPGTVKLPGTAFWRGIVLK